MKQQLSSTRILKELISKQITNVANTDKLQYSDLLRICKYVDTTMFDENNCCKWTGYVTNVNNINKGLYINFYFRKKKVALHRLLYINYVGPIADDEYIKFTCENKGFCCNVTHLRKFKYQKHDNKNNIKSEESLQINKEIINISKNNNPNKFVLSFD